MSKRAYISRYLIIIKKLKAKPYSTCEELQAHLEKQFDVLQMQDELLNMGISKRTLQRDFKEIGNLFGVDIEYSKKEKGYFITQGEMESMNFERMMEAFDMFNSLKIAQDLPPFIYLEKRKPLGTENLYGLLHAIKNKFQIKFVYQKFWETEISQRTVEPYALKEFKNRWYLLAKNGKEGAIKTFALDRLSNLEITNKPFEFPLATDIEKSFNFCFGIISPSDETPQEILLSFNAFQGKYIKSLPLHHSQEIVKDDDTELQVKLKLYITYDFEMELLSFGNNVKVLKPQRLINEIKESHKNAFEQY
ncbi:MAG: WYL domain-containing protein [Ferruginibacter sp.]|nr:WYL domain-containing protein [Ferruginibacter sp.]